jgi:hypothetical protein
MAFAWQFEKGSGGCPDEEALSQQHVCESAPVHPDEAGSPSALRMAGRKWTPALYHGLHSVKDIKSFVQVVHFQIT